MAIPTPTALDIASDNQQTAVKEILTAKYTDASNWAQYGAQFLDGYLKDIETSIKASTASADLAAVGAALAAIAEYTPTGSFTYTAPTDATYTALPTYTAPTLGTIVSLPAVSAVTIPAQPDSTMSFTNSSFTDSVLTALQSRLLADLATQSTGLGSVTETAMFERARAREAIATDEAYRQITTTFSSRGFDMPPGALVALQAQESNKATLGLTDINTQIMAESARLAVDYNKSVISNANALMDIVGKLFDSKVMRDFEKEKTRVTIALEAFKQEVATAIAKAELNKAAITNTVAYNEGVVKVFEGQLAGQVEPMKAIASTNQAVASAYGAQVQAASANLQAQMAPEELKIKGVQANASIGAEKTKVVLEEAKIVIENARHELQFKVESLVALANAAQQMVASALNGVSVSSSFGFGGSVSSSYGITNATSDSFGQGDHANPSLPRL